MRIHNWPRLFKIIKNIGSLGGFRPHSTAYHFPKLFLITMLCATAIFPALANAQSFRDVVALQTRLKQDGYYKSEIDGLVGPSMRKAFKDFGEANDVDATYSDVSWALIESSMGVDRRESTDAEIARSRELVAEVLRDAESARFRGEHTFENHNAIIVCGEVNAKNGYGAYVGYRTYKVDYINPESLAKNALREVEASGESTDGETIESLSTDSEGNRRLSSIGTPLSKGDHEMCQYGTSYLAAGD